ncbi:hypothetical protein JTB14_002947 [Gonioctena quinquepunctata]|nr:hypothetical protein JTB14_002947 [Gonioctena quinquepunctata]
MCLPLNGLLADTGAQATAVSTRTPSEFGNQKTKYTCIATREAVLACLRWTTEKMEVDQKVRRILNAGNMIVTMIENRENWKAVKTYIERIMTKKEQQERERQGI